MNIETQNNNISLLNIYAPNDKKQRNVFFDLISKILNEHSQGIKLIGGDFNEINDIRDRVSSSKSEVKINGKLTNLKRINNLTDIWRYLNPTKNQFTWRRKSHTDKSRIDFWLLDKNSIPLVHASDIRPAIIQSTDHMAISIKLKTPSKRGQGFWKLNNSILSEHEYCTKVKNIIDECSHLHIDSKQIIWEVLKWEVKQMSIEYSKKKSRERQTSLHLLETELNNLLKKDSDTETDKVRIIQVENDIKEIYNFKANGAFVRSRLQFMEEGERNSKFFLSQEKSRQNRKKYNFS